MQLGFDVRDYVFVVFGKKVQKGEFAAVLVGSHGVGEGNVAEVLFAGAEHHQNFVFDTSCRIGRKAGSVLRIEGGNRFYKAYASDGDKLVGVGVVLIFFGNVRHESQVVFYENLRSFLVARKAFLNVFGFFFRGKRHRKARIYAYERPEKHQIFEHANQTLNHFSLRT